MRCDVTSVLHNTRHFLCQEQHSEKNIDMQIIVQQKRPQAFTVILYMTIHYSQSIIEHIIKAVIINILGRYRSFIMINAQILQVSSALQHFRASFKLIV